MVRVNLILPSKSELELQLSKYLYPKVKKAFNATVKDLQDPILKLMSRFLVESPKFQLLINEQKPFYGEFGTTEMREVISQVYDIFRKDFILTGEIVPRRGKIYGQIILKMMELDYQKYLDIPGAEYISKPSGEKIPWLEWILLTGDTRIDEYYISTNLTSRGRERSRTGDALMFKFSGEHWVVPEPFRGAHRNRNLLTESIDGVDPKRLAHSIHEKFKRGLTDGLN